jgi:hypothetical protein
MRELSEVDDEATFIPDAMIDELEDCLDIENYSPIAAAPQPSDRVDQPDIIRHHQRPGRLAGALPCVNGPKIRPFGSRGLTM